MSRPLFRKRHETVQPEVIWDNVKAVSKPTAAASAADCWNW